MQLRSKVIEREAEDGVCDVCSSPLGDRYFEVRREDELFMVCSNNCESEVWEDE